jgi:hypothetical protein
VSAAARLGAAFMGLCLMSAHAGPESPSPGYSAAGLYNLANSYARAGKPGLAVLNYERAKLLAPNDADIQANLDLVRQSARLPVEIQTRFERFATLAAPRTIAWLGIVGIVLAGAGLLVGRISRRFQFLRRCAMAAGLALAALTVCNGWVLWPKLHQGVVIANASAVRVSPVPMGEPLFVLSEAEEVRMTAEHEGFVLVQTRAGRSGWMSRANLASVVPRP